MPIYYGTNLIGEVIHGTQTIGEVYRGSDLSFGGQPAPPAPPPDPTGITLTTLTRTGSSISARRGVGMAGDDEIAVIFGGDTGSRINDMYRAAFTSTGVAVTTLTTTSPPSGRSFHGMVGDHLSGMVFGGRLANGTANGDFFRYVLASDTATTATFTRMTTTGYSIPARWFMGMVGDDDSGMVYGGTTNGSANATDFVRYTRSGNTLTLTNLTISGTNTARRQMGMSGNMTSGLIFGGYSTTRLNDFVKYEVSGNTVTLTTLTQMGDTISARNALSMMSMNGNGVRGLIFGGNAGGRRDDFYFYRVDGNNVHIANLTKTGTIAARQLGAMVGDMTGAIVFGGIGNSGRMNDFVRGVTSA